MWQFLKIEVKEFGPKMLIGKSIQTSFAADRTPELWRSFMPERRRIHNAVGTDLYSLQIYPAGFKFMPPDAQTQFTKWAAVEVSSTEKAEGFEILEIPAGLYAVFTYKGPFTDFAPAFAQIFDEWLPSNGFVPDTRPHFEILGAKYKNGDPESEEDIYIPVRKVNL